LRALLLLLLCFPGVQAEAPYAEERRREGSTLYVQCPYTDKVKNLWKVWCRLEGEQCREIVRTSYYSQTAAKTTIKDNPPAGTVSVTMTDLKTEDSGIYFCAYYSSGYIALKTVSLNVYKGSFQLGRECHSACFGISPHLLVVLQGPSSSQPRSQAMSLSNVNTFILLSVILSILLILALITSVTLCVRLHKVLGRTGNQEVDDTYDNSEGTAQPGSTGRRESPKDDIKGLKHMNLDLQSRPSPVDPLYCNIEPSQAHRDPQGENVEYAVIAFSQFPRS
ncbi:CLM5 protein, partial [Sakesphorus luctuosus]|nr:CLM5 protein [Sakesphorus luctuosus]